jgi:O-acetylserine/cysteine efflux transporter
MELPKANVLALAEALLVTFLWSTSYVLVKIGLKDINPLAFAAYRYIIASAILFSFTFYRYRSTIITLSTNKIILFSALGFSGYCIAQGLQFVALYYLPAITVTFILNLTPIFVLVMSAASLGERPSLAQFLGIVLTMFGMMIYFSSGLICSRDIFGIGMTFASCIGWAAYMVMARYHLRAKEENVVVLTTWSMTLGSLMLLLTAVLAGSVGAVPLSGWAIIVWLSVVNTALAFLLWNRALRILRAYEQSILQNTMLIQITLLAYLFLGEVLTLSKVLGIIMVFIGVLIVQLRSRTNNRQEYSEGK